MFTRLYVKIHGLVQGVGMRYFIATEARRIGVDGYVRNLRDGTVECVAHGKRDDVDALLDAIRTRSPGDVERVETQRLESETTEYHGFEVRF